MNVTAQETVAKENFRATCTEGQLLQRTRTTMMSKLLQWMQLRPCIQMKLTVRQGNELWAWNHSLRM